MQALPEVVAELDRELERANWSEAGLDAYAEAAERLCHCEGLCVCHWDDPDSLAMRQIERAEARPMRSAITYDENGTAHVTLWATVR